MEEEEKEGEEEEEKVAALSVPPPGLALVPNNLDPLLASLTQISHVCDCDILLNNRQLRPLQVWIAVSLSLLVGLSFRHHVGER